jgi:phage virion morphogenesis protein
MLTITVDDSKVMAALAKLRARASDMTPAMTDIGEELVSRILDSFEREASPYGEKWAPLKPATILGRARRFKTDKAKQAAVADPRILQDTGTLRSSIEIQSVGNDHVTVWSRVEYAAVHQFGSTRKNIPAREFFPMHDDSTVDLPPEWQESILNQIALHMKAWNA